MAARSLPRGTVALKLLNQHQSILNNAQGIGFPTEDGIVAAPYWDVESTFWLRWSFDVATLIEVSNP